MDSPNPIFTKGGNRQKPSYQCLVDMVSTSMTKLKDQVEMIKKSFVCTGIILNGRLQIDDLNYRLKEFVINDEDWDEEDEFINNIHQANIDPNDEDNDEIIEEEGCSYFSL